MSRKRTDPGIAVLEYFRTADISVANFVLEQAKVIVKERQPETPKPRKPRKATEVARETV
jgi:hypothetical protein